jgi:tight adherence protein B
MTVESLLQIAVGILLAWLAAGAAKQALRQKMLRERTDAICGTPSHSKNAPVDGGGTIDAHFVMLFEQLGLASDSLATRVYLVLAPVGLALAVAIFGWVTGFGMLGALLLGHLVVIRWQRRRRTQQFTDGLPGLLERVRRLVMIGNTLPHAFIESVGTADPLLKREIEPYIRRVQYGAPFTESIEMLARRNEIVELHMFSAFVRTNAKFGGRVAQTLSNLIDQLTNKRRLDREIKAATAETRASATILLGLMVFLVVIMSLMNPQYFAFYAGNEQGRLIFLCILAWPLTGIFVMKRILALDF